MARLLPVMWVAWRVVSLPDCIWILPPVMVELAAVVWVMLSEDLPLLPINPAEVWLDLSWASVLLDAKILRLPPAVIWTLPEPWILLPTILALPPLCRLIVLPLKVLPNAWVLSRTTVVVVVPPPPIKPPPLPVSNEEV